MFILAKFGVNFTKCLCTESVHWMWLVEPRKWSNLQQDSSTETPSGEQKHSSWWVNLTRSQHKALTLDKAPVPRSPCWCFCLFVTVFIITYRPLKQICYLSTRCGVSQQSLARYFQFQLWWQLLPAIRVFTSHAAKMTYWISLSVYTITLGLGKTRTANRAIAQNDLATPYAHVHWVSDAKEFFHGGQPIFYR